MLTQGLTLLVGGLVVGIIAFIFALVNMGSSLSGERGLGGIFGGHLLAMAVMAMGSLGSVIGLIIIVIHYAERFAPGG